MLGNNLPETWQYNAAGQPTQYQLNSQAPYYYTYSKLSWVGPYLYSQNDVANGNTTFTYDQLGRLLTANCTAGYSGQCPGTGGNVEYGYKYDRYGNRWQQNVLSGTGFAMLLTFSNNGNHVDQNTYDAVGNVTNDGNYTYAYDAENRMLSVNGGSVASYVYDALGRRVQKTATGSVEDFVYDKDGNIVYLPQTNTSYIYIGGRHVGSIGGGSTFFHATDWLGITRQWTNLSGGEYPYCQNTYFGDHQYDCTPPDFFGPGDLYSDGEDNLYHATYRQLNSYQAHWMSPDPAGLAAVDPTNPQTWNRYAYVTNAPLSYIDPTGLACYPLQKQEYGTCAPFMNNGVNFGANWNPIALLGILIIGPGAVRVDGGCFGCGNGFDLFGGYGPASSGNLVAANNLEQKQLKALKGCVKSLYNVDLRTFTPVAPGSNGYFYGLGGPSGDVTVETNVTHSSWYLGLTIFPQGLPPAGRTPLSTSPSQMNYVASDQLVMAPGLIQPSQIHELAHSLDQITSGSIFGSSEASADQLLSCINNNQ